MYSDVDIRKYLGKHIGIYPIIEDNIQGSCVLLTASEYAWSVNAQASCVNDGTITVAAHDTVVLLTNEVVYLNRKLAGYCMVRVSALPHGITSICAPVKPGWIGHLLITLNNVSNRDYHFKVKSGIAILTIHKLQSKCKRGDPKTNSRIELLNNLGIRLTGRELSFINQSYANDRNILFDTLKSDEIYKETKRKLWKTPRNILKIIWGSGMTMAVVSAAVGAIITVVITNLFF